VKIGLVGDELFRADGRTDIKTDMTKLTVAIFRMRLIRISERCYLMTVMTTNTISYNNHFN